MGRPSRVPWIMESVLYINFLTQTEPEVCSPSTLKDQNKTPNTTQGVSIVIWIVCWRGHPEIYHDMFQFSHIYLSYEQLK